jgi:proteasome lid subunit RPN8/RPN11
MRVARPRIVSETKRPIEERKPPDSRVRPHSWLSEESLESFKSSQRSGKPFGLYLSSHAEAKIREHAVKEAPNRLEVLGFMLGEVKSWQGLSYSVALDVVTTQLKSTVSKVRFDPEAFPKLFVGLDGSGFDYVIVGWYHSHPGHTCFLSRTDLDTQRRMFSQPYHSALVIDPVNEDIRAFRLIPGGYEEMPFAIFTPPAAQHGKKSVRRRKLKVEPIVGR